MTFADAFDNMRNVTARVLDRMIEAGIPAYEAGELLRDLSDAEIALRQSFTLDSQRAAFRASVES